MLCSPKTPDMKILIIEDEPSLRDLMERALKKEGYIVETAADRSEGEFRLGTYGYDCVLLDIMLPDGSGLDLLRMIKGQGKSENVIIISAKDSLEDKILGLEEGADDYLAKPFHMAELSARIRSVIRRSRGGGKKGYDFGNVHLDTDSMRVTVNGTDVPMLKKEFDILTYFMQRPGHLIDKAVLAEAVWGDHADQADNFQFVYAQVKNLRRKLEDTGADVEIRAIYGFGYKLTEKDTETK